jgi:hypothetical protein
MITVVAVVIATVILGLAKIISADTLATIFTALGAGALGGIAGGATSTKEPPADPDVTKAEVAPQLR